MISAFFSIDSRASSLLRFRLDARSRSTWPRRTSNLPSCNKGFSFRLGNSILPATTDIACMFSQIHCKRIEVAAYSASTASPVSTYQMKPRTGTSQASVRIDMYPRTCRKYFSS